MPSSYRIKDFIAGEDFSIFNETVLDLLEAVPELRGDLDLGATNEEDQAIVSPKRLALRLRVSKLTARG